MNYLNKAGKILFGIVIFCYLLFAPLLISEQYHSYGGYIPNLIEEPLLSEIGARKWALETGLVNEGSLAYRIIDCESRWREWECNRNYGCKAGIGLWQIVVSTWNDTIVKMSKDKNTPHDYMPENCWQFVSHPMSYEKREIIFNGECNLLVNYT